MDAWQPPPPEAAEYEFTEGSTTFDCDFDSVDEFPSQEVFDQKYWNQAPLRIRNGTRNWPAVQDDRLRWTKQRLIALGGPGNNTSAM
jgi:hypothetical protein